MTSSPPRALHYMYYVTYTSLRVTPDQVQFRMGRKRQLKISYSLIAIESSSFFVGQNLLMQY